MATWDYGYAPADVVTDAAGDVLAGIELRVWDAEVAGKAVAVQQDRGDGWKPASRVLTDDVGRYRFRAEAGPTVWVEDVSGRRWRMDAWQTLGTMIDSAQSATAAAESANSIAHEAMSVAQQAQTSAKAAADSAAAVQGVAPSDANVSPIITGGAKTAEAVRKAALAAFPTTGPTIFTHFLTRDEALHVAISTDGVTVEDTGLRWKPKNDTTLGECFVRDPSVCFWKGAYWVAFTRPTKGGGDAFGTTKSFGLMKTTDWRTFQELPPVVMPSQFQQTWAPQWFIGSDGVPHIFVALGTTTTPNAYFTQYELRPLDDAMTSWSDPVVMSGLPANCIDVAVIEDAGTFHAFPSNQKTSTVEQWTSTGLTGPYTKLAASDFPGAGVEGPQPVPLKTGGWRIYVDNYAETDSIYFAESTDLLHWSALRPVTLPMRHVGAVAVDSFGALRTRELWQPNIPGMRGMGAPFWGVPFAAGNVLKEFAQIVSMRTDGGGEIDLAKAATLGFTGIDYISATAVANVEILQIEPDIRAVDSMIHGVALRGPSTPQIDTDVKVAWRVLGWGDPSTP
ncbi:Hypothetical protein PFR_JS22-PH_18 [Propionibacterium freudenreichii]|uniref:hypothetical protein n=1 Tax=Propionibacterium freudenreichii TaxID=1744 RepID=UPI00054399AF|nr:hypothetical protein [Propionibacterium freudenreichii]CEH07849.1 Alpha L-arabinofuranosidase [Propionibacterium freudenreichii]SBW77592.1 Hypothetical protein PFR_JS22-1_1944 [Propionibacterium freudenreichii]SCP02346.1 Hypothetical protein PFR_JS22-PH_18 [Propionibacterium freudenreichii]